MDPDEEFLSDPPLWLVLWLILITLLLLLILFRLEGVIIYKDNFKILIPF